MRDHVVIIAYMHKIVKKKRKKLTICTRENLYSLILTGDKSPHECTVRALECYSAAVSCLW